MDKISAENIKKYLSDKKAKFYGINGCGHCDAQKKDLGKDYKNYFVDCDNKKNAKACAKVEGFPTWDINGKLYPGHHTLKELSKVVKKPELLFNMLSCCRLWPVLNCH